MNVLCFGDSNTFGISPLDGKRFSDNERWPSLLQQFFGQSYKVIEAGQPNRTLVKAPSFDGDKSGVKYLKPYLEAQPIDVIIIMLGTNDLKARFALTPEQIAQELEQLIAKIKHFYKYNLNKGTCHLPRIVILSPPKVVEVGLYRKIYEGAAKKSKILGSHLVRVAKEHHCEFLDCYQLVETCKTEGIHLPKSEHVKLAKALYQRLIT